MGRTVGCAALLAGVMATGTWACSPQGHDGATETSGWQLEGTLTLLVADFEDGSYEERYELRLDDEQTFGLVFDERPDIEPNVRIGVSGSIDAKGNLRVSDYAVLTPTGPRTVAQPLIGAETYPVKNIAVLLVAPGGNTNNETIESMRQKVFTNDNSTAAYYDEASYGIESLTGDVFGWFTVAGNALSGCGTNELASQAREAAQNSGVNLSEYGQIMYYFPRSEECSWGGLAQIGRPLSPARDSWYNGSSGCVVLAHELGHNYGLMHSGSHDCDTEPLVENVGQCSTSEYGDPFCPMGGGCWHFQAYQKAALGYLQGCNLVDVRHDGSFAIEPMASPTNGIQTLRIRLGDSEDYLYLEYRQPIGFDANPRNSQGSVYEGVLIRVAPYTGFNPSVRPSSTKPNILDMTPGSRNSGDHDDAALPVGESYTTLDGNVTITVDAANEHRAQVRIEFADGGSAEAPTTCQDGSLPPVVVVGGGDTGGDGDGDGDGGDGDPAGGEPLPNCVQLSDWAPGTTETAVRHRNHKYSCIADDLCGLASASIYEPGVGLSWSQAWAYEGECEPAPDPNDPGAGSGSGGGIGEPGAGPGGSDLESSRSGSDADSHLVGRWSCSVSSGGSVGGLPVGVGWALLGWAAFRLRRRPSTPQRSMV